MVRRVAGAAFAAGPVDLCLQRVEALFPAGGRDELGKPLDQLGEPLAVEHREPLPANEFIVNQAALPEYPQVTAHGKSTDHEAPGDLSCREPPVAQHHEDFPSHGVRNRSRHLVHHKKRNRSLAPGGHLALACFAAGKMGSELSDAEFYRHSHLDGGLAYTPESLRWIFSHLTEVELRRMRDEPPESPRFGEPFLWTALFRHDAHL